jgi:hypothetical protein
MGGESQALSARVERQMLSARRWETNILGREVRGKKCPLGGERGKLHAGKRYQLGARR